MASAIRSALALRHRLSRLLSATTRSMPRPREEERQFLVRGAGLPTVGDPHLFSSNAAGRSYTHPCKLNLGHKRLMGMDGQLDSINMAVKKDVRGWKALREQVEAFEQNEIKRAEVYKRQDRVVAYASAAVALALLGAKCAAWLRQDEEMAEGTMKPLK